MSFLNTFSTMKEGSPLSVFRRPMTAVIVSSSIISASVKAKSIYMSVNTVSAVHPLSPIVSKIYNGERNQHTWVPSS
ncbi:Os03g0781200 [Oryza sativa Japonica Group]|uniref:Os03g0781200 protein n=2 Tax=Oryza sativa subsp. japonica TaxID=39947 RepID=Q0DN16_ORYSJ|nr:unknown protein [Oryza sativa Japonica Group]KAB8093836.1 hypothetical protein EE612_020803 [Oryza sativa]BAF13372.1 Os03g0781200 [Oryza sativa Japonica Group]BAS86682.1 Os03g0781200 [Oryza sativa Japonica Group]|eukprot:NP_001051458.1 Os03g0781200 [Oryza sativa Japonica Group]